MRLRALWFALVVLPAAAFAQSGDSVLHSTIGYSYFSQGGLNPGLTITVEKSLLASSNHQMVVAGKAGLYFHYRNNTGAFVMIQSGQRFRLSRHFSFEHFAGVGFLQSFLNGGDAYYVNASGQIQKASKIGNPHFMPSISFGVSYLIKNRTRYYVRPMVYWLIPFNQSSLVQYAVEAGVSFRLKQ